VARFYERSAPDSTLDTEASNWNWWMKYCACTELWHTPNCGMRPDRRQLSYEEQMLEETLWAGAVPWIHKRMRNRAGVVGAAKPSSVMNVLRGVRRAHLRQRVDTVALQAAVRACGGLMRDYIELHGPDALMPHRKEPLTNPLIRKLLTLAEGTELARGKYLYWASPKYASLRAMFATLAQTGMRKAEVSLSPKVVFGRTHLAMANVRWLIGGRIIDAPTVAQFAAMVDGDYALLRPPPSKADQFSLHWGASTIYLRYYTSAVGHPICAARELRSEEMRRAVPAARRSMVPLFVSDSSDAPWRHGPLTDTFGQMMAVICGGADAAACYSMHSFRIYLACALLSAGASNGTIQTMLRWRSDDALRIYARINDSKYAEWLTLAGAAEVSSVRTTTTDVVRRMETTAATAAGGAAGFGDHWMEAAAASDATFDRAMAAPQHDADSFVRAWRDDASSLLEHAVRHDAADNVEFGLGAFPSPWEQ
jgi:integrase